MDANEVEGLFTKKVEGGSKTWQENISECRAKENGRERIFRDIACCRKIEGYVTS